ncbi:MAG: hypothetical protein JXD22_15200 [Sedimentisphaerales bacterium]|nr:hypothetical protein [Sedimentisphaerales bacterium]
MKKSVYGTILLVLCWTACLWAQEKTPEVKPDKDPWIGKYCMSIFTKTRTAKTVGKDRLALAIKFLANDFDEAMDSSGCYRDFKNGDHKQVYTATTIAKYGWAKNHHLALGVPYIWNNSKIKGDTFNNNGIGNIFVFEKWNFVQETNTTPAVAVDVWHYFPTGNSIRKVGSDDYAWKFTTEISKAWKDFNIHINPGYCISQGRDNDIIEGNAAIVFTPCKTFWPAIEYNYTYKECKGRCSDLIPGIIWKFTPDASFKIGPVINLDSSMKYRDDIGLIMKLCYIF